MLARAYVIAAGLGLFATPALAANAAMDSLLALCAANHGEARAVFAAAEADGWTMRPGCVMPRTDDAKVGDLLATLDMTPCNLWRYKTVGGLELRLRVVEEHVDWEDGHHRIRRCAITDPGASLDSLQAAATAGLGAPPQPKQGPKTAWIWTEGPAGRSFLPPTTEAVLGEAVSRGPVYAVQLDPGEPEPTLIYSELLKTDAVKP